MKPIVAIVGRPNVGKSTFFNRLIGQRKAIIADVPGTTRDRLYGDSDWNGRVFTVVDTAGLLFQEEDENAPLAEISRHVRAQAELAIDEADVIIFLVDSVDQAVECVARLDRMSRAGVRSRFEERFTARRMAEDYLRLFDRSV